MVLFFVLYRIKLMLKLLEENEDPDYSLAACLKLELIALLILLINS